MRITNAHGLPQPIVDAVINDDYTKGDAWKSVTGLLRPPRIAVLEKQFADEIEEDAADRIFSLLGQAVHTILERAEKSAVAEQRLYMDVDDVTISGKTDRVHLASKCVSDYKVCSFNKVKYGRLDPEFEKQMNCYVELLRANGYEIERGEVIHILRDWSKMQINTPDYPQKQIITLGVPIWPREKTQAFIRERIRLHKEAETSLPLCTDEERWARAPKWAVMKAGGKKSIKNYEYDEKDLAVARATGMGTDYSVVLRPGGGIRCMGYCPVSKVCTQYQESKGVTNADCEN